LALAAEAGAQTPRTPEASAAAPNGAASAIAPTPAGSAPAPATSAPAASSAGPSARNPHQALRDESTIAGDLPIGTVEGIILDGNDRPLGNTQVRLGIIFSRISEGESRSEKFAVTDGAGRVRFPDLKIGPDYSYRVTLKSGRASYGSAPFNLGDQAGHRVRLHVFPVTSNVREAAVGMRNMIYVEPRDDVFQFEVLYRVINVGTVTWVPDDSVVMPLPPGFKAFNAQREMSGAGFVQVDGVGARLDGTFPPGQVEVRFRFQAPKPDEETASFRVTLLPNVFDSQVIAEASSKMKLNIAGFDEPIAASPEGKRVLIARKNFTRGEQAEPFTIELSGLPTPGFGRWVAVLIASALGLTGFAAYRGVVQLESGSSDARDRDLENARELLLAELVEIEKAHRAGDLGPRAYTEGRRTLLEALARLGRDALAPKKTKRKAKRQRDAA
jgi:hypothetical protein